MLEFILKMGGLSPGLCHHVVSLDTKQNIAHVLSLHSPAGYGHTILVNQMPVA